jgi:hypothetical protein
MADSQQADSQQADSRFEFCFGREPWVCTGAVRVTDPAYSRMMSSVKGPYGLSIAGILSAKAGHWQTCVIADTCLGIDTCLISWERGSAGLELGDAYSPPNWEAATFHAAVDSGQCGFFDDAHYPEASDAKRQFDDEVDIITEDGKFGLVRWGDVRMPRGVVTFSGLGDGVYDVFVHRTPEGIIDAVRVQFLTEDEEPLSGEDTPGPDEFDMLKSMTEDAFEPLEGRALDTNLLMPSLLEIDDV